jgi:hypothetical protein
MDLSVFCEFLQIFFLGFMFYPLWIGIVGFVDVQKTIELCGFES